MIKDVSQSMYDDDYDDDAAIILVLVCLLLYLKLLQLWLLVEAILRSCRPGVGGAVL